MNHCKTCKHWNEWAGESDWGDCTKINSKHVKDQLFDPRPGDYVRHALYSSHEAFGCVLHEPRE